MAQDKHPIRAGAIRIALPDATQLTDYSCGASSLQAICKFYGVGPNEEWEFVGRLGMDRRVGSHPHQIVGLARRLGLSAREYFPMTIADIKRELRLRHPVMLMIQAWGEEKRGRSWRPRRDYSEQWGDGHWVVAIGYDASGIFFEDPSLELVRGFLTYDELLERWRDTGPRGRRMANYGVAIWHPRRKRSAYETISATID